MYYLVLDDISLGYLLTLMSRQFADYRTKSAYMSIMQQLNTFRHIKSDNEDKVPF